MDQIRYQVPPGFVWPTVGHPGRVPIWALVGDPNQPRTHFDEKELSTLASTMKIENGGEQREIVTVSELSEKELLDLAPVRFRIVSGERRWRAAKIAGLADIEIRVKSYETPAERKLDMYMLNEGRVQLSDIEDARYLRELMREFDLTTDEELAALTGKTVSHISTHLALLKLVPEVQAFMEPSIPERSRLRMAPALILSRLEKEVQADYANRMPKGDGVSIRRQVDWIKAEITRTGAKTRTRELTPGTVRRSIEYLSEMTSKRLNEIFTHKAFEKIFDKATPAHREILLGSVKKMLGKVESLVEKIEAQLPEVTTSAKPKPVMAKNVHLLKPSLKPPPVARAVPSNSFGNKVRKVAPAPSVIGGTGKEKTVTYMGPNGRMVTDKVSQKKYLELWDKKELGFQIQNKERPAWMPTREGAVEDWDKYCD